MFTLALALLVAQVNVPEVPSRVLRAERVQRVGGRTGGASYAAFEAFPTSGAGIVGGPCTTTAPTGAKGEVLTFSRASNATCTRTASGGLATTGIANGDLVVLTNNQPRVEYDANGVLGLLVEASRTNSLLRSQELDNAAWLLAQGGAPAPGNPTITANAAIQPDGTTTAERVDFPAVSGTGFSVVYQGVTGTAAQWTASCYARGVSGSGTFYMMLTPGGSYTSAACSYVSTSWTRCSVTATETAAAWFLQLGVDLRDGTQSAQSAQSVYITDCQWELGGYATSYTPTTSASVTRAVETSIFASVSGFPLSPLSIATTITPSWSTSASARGLVSVQANSAAEGNDLALLFTASTGDSRCWLNTGYDSTVFTGSAGSSSRGWCAFDFANGTVANRIGGNWNGVAMLDAVAPVAPGTAVQVQVGMFGTVAQLDGIVSRICVDPSPARCR